MWGWIAALALVGYALSGRKPRAPQGPYGPPVPSPSGDGGVPTLGEQQEARQLASQVASDVRSRGYDYDRGMMRRFQALAHIAVDGLYGPVTAGAIEYFTGDKAPPALFHSKRFPNASAPIPYSPNDHA